MSAQSNTPKNVHQPVSILDVYTTPLHGHTLIEASAGTGKTWTISGLYTRLLLDETLNLKVSEILVVTFTRAATAELRDRIRSRLADVLASFRSGEGVDEFCQRILEGFNGDRERAIRKLTRAVAGFDEAAIFTIDGFCQRLLGEAAFESGAEFNFELLTNERELLQEITEDFWRLKIHAASGRWLDYLLMQEASPGEWLKPLQSHLGKVKQHWPLPEPEMLEADEAAWPASQEWLQQQWVREAEALKAQVSEAKINKTTRVAMLKRWDKIDALLRSHELISPLLRKEILADLDFFTATKVAKSPLKGADPLKHAIFDAVEALVNLANRITQGYELKMCHLRAELMTWITAESIRRKALRQHMTFDDLLNQVWNALQGEQYEAFCNLIRQRYRAALIDEFQDTNPVQCSIFQTVYAGSGLPLYYVGDPKQSIYGFRGADIRAYLNAKTQVPAEAVKTLSTNQRSIPALVGAINTLFGGEQVSVPFIDQGIGFHPVEVADREHAALVIEGDDGIPFRFLLLPENPEDPEKCWKKDAAIDAATEGAANEIARLLTLGVQGKAHLDGRPLHGGDIAVLVQDSWKAEKIHNALTERGVPSVRQVKDSVYTSFEAQQLLLVLTAVAQPNRLDLVRTALSTDLMGYSLDSLVAMMEDNAAWDGVLDQFTEWHALWRDHGFMRLFRQWLDTPGPDGLAVSERLLAYVDGERRLTNVLHLAELIQAESRRALGLDSLVTWLACQMEDPQSGEEGDPTLVRLESDAQRVKIVTIHKSKGLEYPIIFCPYLFDSRLPKSEEAVVVHHEEASWLDLGSPDMDKHRVLACKAAMQENLRLLYVALTRPKYRCYVAWGNVNVLGEAKDTTTLTTQLAPGFHTSPLSWLIHPCPDQASVEDPLSAMRTWCTAYKDRARIQQDINALIAQTPDTIGCYDLPQQWVRVPEMKTQAPELAPQVFNRPALKWGWQVASFSGLTRTTRHVKTSALTEIKEAPDRDEQAPPVEIEVRQDAAQLPSVFNYPLEEIKANVAGTCVHNILEAWNWDEPDTLAAIVERERIASGLKERWNPILIEMVENTVHTVLLPAPSGDEPVQRKEDAPIQPRLKGFDSDEEQESQGHGGASGEIKLAAISRKQRLAEMEFTFPVANLSMAAIQTVLAHPGHNVAPAFIEAAQGLSFDTLHGYLKGFIDLIFQANGQFYVLDYKTNWLGNRVEDYHARALEESVAQHHYYLQYLLYTVAVHRYLRERLVDYDYERHMGGVLYVFQRGLGDRTGRYGVHRDRPTLALIEAFDAMLLGKQGEV